MLILPIKKKWFEMILSGKKQEEYREIKPYYTSRIVKVMGYPKSEEADVIELLRKTKTNRTYRIGFRNGYSRDSPSFDAKCYVSIGTGISEWGADPGEEYFIFTIREII